ncbi:MAG: hypothetical protein ACI3YP_09745 [Prevotella sp.]
MTTKYIIYNYYFQRSIGRKEERMSAELCAKLLEKFMPDECKENGLKIVGTKKKGGEQELSHHGNRLEQHFRNMACLLVEANINITITIRQHPTSWLKYVSGRRLGNNGYTLCHRQHIEKSFRRPSWKANIR